MKLANAVTLVTGANRGLGRSLVKALIDAGTPKIYVAARDLSTLTEYGPLASVVPLELDIQNWRSRSVGTTGHVQTESAVKMVRHTQVRIPGIGVHLLQGSLSVEDVHVIGERRINVMDNPCADNRIRAAGSARIGATSIVLFLFRSVILKAATHSHARMPKWIMFREP